MKSLLIGRPGDIRRVYPDDILTSLREEAGLDTGTILTRDELASAGPADADCLFSTWGMPALAEEEIARFFPKLKAVFYAAGTVQGFARPFLNRGIRIFSAWGANAVPVAEFTVSQILLANKGFFGAAALCSAGQVQAARRHAAGFPGNVRCKVGIIGAGMIGSMVIRMLHGRELDVLVYDPFLPPEKAAEWGVRSVSLETLFSECQTVSNHLANNPRTAGILNYPLFSLMPANGVFINTGRGAQVVEADLVRALTEQPGRTALLDVTSPEPPEAGHAFYRLPNVWLSPHIAGSTGHEVERMSRYMLEEFRRLRQGEPALYEVTLPMLATMA